MTENKDHSRRDILKRSAQAAAIVGASAAGAMLLREPDEQPEQPVPAVASLPSVGRFDVELPKGAPRMAVARGDNPMLMLRQILDQLGGIGRFVEKGDTVLLKPNVGFDRSPALGATTSPEVMGALTALCREAGAGRVIVADNPINNPEGCFLKTGIGRAVEENGGEIMLPSARRFCQVQIGGETLREWECFHEPLRLADKVIGVPTAKDHNLCGASLAMKNWYGLLGTGRNRFHQSIDAVIADLGAFITPTLIVLDATRLLMRNGPTGGSPADVRPGNTIAASVDQVAIDAFGLELLEKKQDEAPWLEMAERRGIGTRDWRSLVGAEGGDA